MHPYFPVWISRAPRDADTFPKENGIVNSCDKLLQGNSEQLCNMHPRSALQVSELKLLHPGSDSKLGVALPAHVLWLHKQVLLPTAGN